MKLRIYLDRPTKPIMSRLLELAISSHGTIEVEATECSQKPHPKHPPLTEGEWNDLRLLGFRNRKVSTRLEIRFGNDRDCDWFRYRIKVFDVLGANGRMEVCADE